MVGEIAGIAEECRGWIRLTEAFLEALFMPKWGVDDSFHL